MSRFRLTLRALYVIIILSSGNGCASVIVGISYAHKDIGKIELTLKEFRRESYVHSHGNSPRKNEFAMDLP